MTERQLIDNILPLIVTPSDFIEALKNNSSYDGPEWTELVKQYDPKKHKIMDTTTYPVKRDSDGVGDDFKRTPLALQKLAVDRTAQSMFATPVKRVYNFDRDSERAEEAKNIIEELYRTVNSIDGSNIERAKMLNASCQVATVWAVYEKRSFVANTESKFTLYHSNYSPLDGYELYPIFDPTGDLLVMSIGYLDNSNIKYFDVYANTESQNPAFLQFNTKSGDWALDEETSNELDVFPVTYRKIKEPVWGGESGTILVEQLEEMTSYQGMYIKTNTVPTFVLDYGDTEGSTRLKSATEQSSDKRRIIEVGKGGKMDDATWEGATEAIKFRTEFLRNAFFEQIQVPDTSFSNMVAHSISADNREMVFADAKAKAKDLGGEWEKLFFDELNIVLEMAKVLYPNYAAEFEKMSVRSVIQPYSIRTRKENAEYISLSGDAMSRETKITVLGEVDNVQAEAEAIETELSTDANFGL